MIDTTAGWPAGSRGAQFATEAFTRITPGALRGIGSNAISFAGDWPYENPDDLWQKHGITLARDMWRKDDTVRYAVGCLQTAAISTGWEIMPGAEDPEDTEPADFMNAAIDMMEESFTDFLMRLQDADLMGFSIHEPTWSDPIPKGKWQGKQYINRLYQRDSSKFAFRMDDNGRVLKIVQRPLTGHADVEFEPHELVYHVCDMRDNNPHGNTPARTAYRYYFIKEQVIFEWANYLERYGRPMPMVRYPVREGEVDSTATRTNKQTALEIADQLRKNTKAAMPAGWELDLNNPNHYMNVNLYRELITICNRGIYRSWQIPALLGETAEGGGGAYALGKEHGDQFEWPQNVRRASIEETITNQLFRPMTVYNFGDAMRTPRFAFKPFHEVDMLAIAETLKVAVNDLGMDIPTDYAHERLNIPQAEEGEDTLKSRGGDTAAPGIGAFRLPDGQQQIARPASDQDEAEIEEEPEEEPTKMAVKTRRALTPLERQINFAAINEAEDSDAAFSGENLGILFEGLAGVVEEQAGKGNGGQLAR